MRAFAFILCCAVATGCVTSGTERRLAALEQELEQLHSPQHMRELEGAAGDDRMIASLGDWVPQVSKVSLLGALAPTTVAGIGGVTLGTSQTITGAKTFSATLTSTVASGSDAVSVVQGARIQLGGGPYIYSDGSRVITLAGGYFGGTLEAAGTVFADVGIVIGSSGTITNSLNGSAVVDFAATTNTTLDSSGITVTGAATGDVCIVGAPTAAAVAGATFTCYVSATSTVKVRLTAQGTSIDPASGTFNVRTFH